jgi:hypothetical protein
VQALNLAENVLRHTVLCERVHLRMRRQGDGVLQTVLLWPVGGASRCRPVPTEQINLNRENPQTTGYNDTTIQLSPEWS